MFAVNFCSLFHYPVWCGFHKRKTKPNQTKTKLQTLENQLGGTSVICPSHWTGFVLLVIEDFQIVVSCNFLHSPLRYLSVCVRTGCYRLKAFGPLVGYSSKCVREFSRWFCPLSPVVDLLTTTSWTLVSSASRRQSTCTKSLGMQGVNPDLRNKKLYNLGQWCGLVGHTSVWHTADSGPAAPLPALLPTDGLRERQRVRVLGLCPRMGDADGTAGFGLPITLTLVTIWGVKQHMDDLSISLLLSVQLFQVNKILGKKRNPKPKTEPTVGSKQRCALQQRFHSSLTHHNYHDFTPHTWTLLW